MRGEGEGGGKGEGEGKAEGEGESKSHGQRQALTARGARPESLDVTRVELTKLDSTRLD